MRRSSKKPRGQTLVLFSLALLLLVLMVLVTLGMGMRARDAMATQLVADSAAYSQAVVTARTLNAIAVMNRAQLADAVALAGNQSLISYSTKHVTALHKACGEDNSPVTVAAFDALDAAAARQSQYLLNYGVYFYQAGMSIHRALFTHLHQQSLTRRIVEQTGDATLSAPPQGGRKSVQEVFKDEEAPPDPEELRELLERRPTRRALSLAYCGAGIVCPAQPDPRSSIHAAMGTLGWEWVNHRADGTGNAAFGTNRPIGGPNTYASADEADANRYGTLYHSSSLAHDHGGPVSVTCKDGRQATVTVGDAWVMSDGIQSTNDQHYGDGRVMPLHTPEVMNARHTIGSCVMRCPAGWPMAVDFNAPAMSLAGVANDFRQPKLYAIVERDLGARRADPWELSFRYRFTGGAGTEFDHRATRQGKQVALGAGLAYYHRPAMRTGGGGWVEPPNLLNPFWRATLVSPLGTSDDDPADRITQAGFPEHGETLRLLLAQGFRASAWGGP